MVMMMALLFVVVVVAAGACDLGRGPPRPSAWNAGDEKATSSWEQQLRDAARASIATLDNGPSAIKRMLDPRFDVYRLLVIDGHLYVHESFLRVDKSRKFATLVAMVAHRLPNVVWLHDSGARSSARSLNGSLPTTLLSRRVDQKGILVPNPYFGRRSIGTWDKDRSRFEKLRIPFERRIPKVFWRGSVGSKRSCSQGTGNYARLQAVTLTTCREDLFDVRCQHGCADGTNTTFDPTCFPRDDDFFDLKNLATTRHFVDPADYSKYQFLLNLPGSTSGSYSRNLNHLWAMGSVVLLWHSPYVEWYYAALRHGTTHLSVDKSSILHAIETLQNDRATRDRLIRNALEVDRRLVCGTCILDFVVDVIHLIHDHLDGLLDDDDNRLLATLNYMLYGDEVMTTRL
ncbi:hypothetical protein CTAYLR_008765 [Chrysophaeum taylorii]|uniref:Glycosyl transferase CAP10 domain-containing protein n=1 Tax=Chrysophaeum taylorii TaxID=2483200 RepID=A0AAD7XKA8_9STRA|nr:hypothetical protein CTAYLR_008765 [Chrysophaeum taylorii]